MTYMRVDCSATKILFTSVARIIMGDRRQVNVRVLTSYLEKVSERQVLGNAASKSEGPHSGAKQTASLMSALLSKAAIRTKYL